MPEKGLTLKVLFKAIDEMSGPLKAIGVQFDNLDKLTQAATKSAKAYAAIGALSVAAGVASGKIGGQVSGAIAAATPLDESLTRLKQIAPAIDSARAAKDALNQVSTFGVASLDQEVDALARAVQLYGSYDKAVAATSAANRLALATHQPVIDALNQTAAVSQTAGQSVDQVSDKLAAMWKAAGGAGNLSQVQRAWGMAKSHGENLEHFLAVMAEAQKAGIGGRSLAEYYEETSKKGGHWGMTTAALHSLIDKQSADIAKIEAQIRASAGVSSALAATEMASPAAQRAREQRISEASSAATGAPLLRTASFWDRLNAMVKLREASFALDHPKIVGAAEDAYAGAGYGLRAAWKVGAGIGALKFFLPRLVGTAATWSASAEAAALAAAVPVAFGAAAVGAGTAAAYGYGPGRLIAGETERAIGALESWLWKTTPAKKPTISNSTVNSPKTSTIVVHNSTTVNVTVGNPTAQETAVAVKAALDAHDRELEDKLKRAVDHSATVSERANF